MSDMNSARQSIRQTSSQTRHDGARSSRGFRWWRRVRQADVEDRAAMHSHQPFPGWIYGVLFVLFDIIAVITLEIGVSTSSSRVELSNPTGDVGIGFVTKMWNNLNFVFVLNMLLVGLLYACLLMLFNRFWLSSGILVTAAIIVAALEHFKVQIRYEAILPADLGFLGSNTGNMLTFIPSGAHVTILICVAAFAVILALILLLRHIDGRRGRLIRTEHRGLGFAVRLICLLVPALVFTLYCLQVSTTDSWANKFSQAMGDKPSMWDSVYDAQRNGPLVAFTRQLNPTVMDKPDNYSEETMREVAARYEGEAEKINASRTSNLTDSTVVFILSESFSDPSRVPGLSVNKDSMPYIRSVKSSTTSGLMLSSGYGGGTANLEYMGLTGLSMANFDSSLTSPYQQLVPSEHWTPTVNQMWGVPENSLAYHPYESSMYSRATNYKKFGFSHFYTLTGSDVIKYQDKIDKSPYVSDEATYTSALEEIASGNANQFIQIITMQNHMPYHEWYANNDFTAESTTGTPLSEDEQTSIETYQKGVSITDQATRKFLEGLDRLDKPVTVVFYGDHLPGIYESASENDDNSLALHLTDYFIWSNKASGRQGTNIDSDAYSSPNFFIAQTAEHMNAKVSPYLAFLTRMHAAIAAMEPPVVNQIQGWERIPEGQDIYLDHAGNPMNEDEFDDATRQLLNDYKLIQYDITAGKGYLKDTDFMTLPNE